MERRAPLVPRVYAIADRAALGATPLPAAVAQMADAGVRWIQLRMKPALSDRQLLAITEQCLRALEGSGALLWMDDRADLVALLGLPGLHLGQQDLPPGVARHIIGEHCLLGLSTHHEAQVSAAEGDPAVDVVAFGPVFSTLSKANPDPTTGLQGLRRARGLTTKPLVAIGGIDAETLPQVLAAGADAAVVLGAVCQGDVARNARRLLDAAGGGP